MTEVVQLTAPQGSFLASVSLFRLPDGTIRAALDDMPVPVIEARDTISERFELVAEWCRDAAADFDRQAMEFKE